MNKQENPIEHIVHLEEEVIEQITESRNKAVERFPFMFLILTTFGTITTLSGFQKLVEKVDWLVNNPFLLLAVGLVTLFVTGTLYKKLG